MVVCRMTIDARRLCRSRDKGRTSRCRRTKRNQIDTSSEPTSMVLLLAWYSYFRRCDFPRLTKKESHRRKDESRVFVTRCSSASRIVQEK
eukprot:9478903-Pyramimonas_sp.AAC.1